MIAIRLLVPATQALAFCEVSSGAQATSVATTVFVGKALSGPVAGPSDAALLSPVTFSVDHYLKGSGPLRVRVQTEVSRSNGVQTTTEDLISPRAGQWWIVYSPRTTGGIVQTSFCAGSHLVAAPARLSTTGSGTAAVTTLALLTLAGGWWLRDRSARYGCRTWDPVRARRI